MNQTSNRGSVVLTAWVLFAVASSAAAQDVECEQGAPRFSAWSAPVRLDSVNSPTPSNDFHPAISPDGLSLYISSNRSGGSGDNDIWVSQRSEPAASWQKPVNLGPNINSAASDFAPNFSPDGHWLLFSSTRKEGGYGADDVWASFRDDETDNFGWGRAFNLGPAVNTAYDENAPALLVDPDTGRVSLYFNSILRPGALDYDIYRMTLFGPDASQPATPVTQLNSPGRDTRVAIRNDGLELFLTSNRPGGSGKIDLWASTRASTADDWSAPVNLGPTVNSKGDDGGPALSNDARTLYFYSTRAFLLSGKRELYSAVRTRLCGSD